METRIIKHTAAYLLALLLSSALGAQVWQPVNGPFGGTVNCIAIDSSGVIFVGTEGGGVFRSIDNGDTWAAANSGITSAFIKSICVAPNQHVFIGTLDGNIFKSEDAGSNWTLAYSGTNSVNAIGSNSQGMIIGGYQFGILRSFDDGLSWTQSLIYGNVTGIGINAGDTLYAACSSPVSTYSGLYQSMDHGASWTPHLIGQCPFIAINSSGHVFTGPGTLYMLRSMDHGATWTTVALPAGAVVTSLGINSMDVIYAGTQTGQVLRSSDNGATWASSVAAPNFEQVRAIGTIGPDHVFAGLDIGAGMSRSADAGVSWLPVNEGLTASHVYALATNSSNHYFACTYAQGMFRSLDQGDTWQSINNGLPDRYAGTILIDPDGHLFVGTFAAYPFSGIYRSVDNGDTWTLVSDSTSSTQVYALAINSAGHLFAGTPYNGVLRSLDNGVTWTQIASGGLLATPIRGLVANASDHLFAVNGSAVIRSLDGGITWNYSSSGMVGWAGKYIAVNANDDLFAAISYTGGDLLYRSTANGTNWENVSPGIPNLWIQAMAFPATPGYVIAGSAYDGVLVSSTNGDNWWPHNDGLINPDIRSLVIDQSGTVLAGTNGAGVFKATMQLGMHASSVGTPLLENAPNPCSEFTTIRYHLSTSATISLDVLDVQGRLVRRLKEGFEAMGTHTLDLDVAALESGIYFYRLVVDGRPSTKRLIVAR